ncbi:MAG: VWA-like domain-containing protein [Treponema sp.]|jgi:predicted metal-dependent peptidase|nr:VWA-like domain-containing protein [Treponema sp.]
MGEQVINANKAAFTEEQTENACSALVAAGIIAPRVKRIRIPPPFEDISLSWIKNAPFFAEFMFRFHFFETRSIPTVGVNCIRGNINFYFNPDFIYGSTKPLTHKEMEGLIVHEIEHLIRLHRERMLEDALLFYSAGDMLINENIKTLKINNAVVVLPQGAVYLDMIRNPKRVPGSPAIPPYHGEPVTEPVYRWLTGIRQQFQHGNEGSYDTGTAGTGKKPGQGAGQHLFEDMFNSKIDDHTILDTSDALTESTLGKIIESAVISGWGTMGGTGAEALQALLKPAHIPWTQHLRRVLSPLLYDYGPYFEHTWARRNRRNLPLPGMRRLSNKLLIAVDTSGSISESLLQQFFTEIEKMTRDFSQLILMQWDTRITNVETAYKKGSWKNIPLTGRGGTHVQCVFDWTQEHGYTKYPLLIFTDGYFDYDFDVHGIQHIIWVVTGYHHIPQGKNIAIL